MINLSGGTESVAHSLKEYQEAWKAFIVVHHLDSLLTLATPTTLSWKVGTKTDLFANLQAVADNTEQVHIGTVNDRFIASIVLKQPLDPGLAIVKIMERRPGSSDPLGLDSLDFLVKDSAVVFDLLIAAKANVVKEHNEMHDWLSLRFGNANQYEAKFTDHTVLYVALKELTMAAEAAE